MLLSPVVLRGAETGKRRLVTLRLGLIAGWAKDAKIGYSTINAMAETVAIKLAFRDAFKSRPVWFRPMGSTSGSSSTPQ